MKCQPYIVTSNAFIETMHMVEHNEIQSQQNLQIINPNSKCTKIIVSHIKEFNIFSFTCEVEFQNFYIIVDAISAPSPLLPTLSTYPHSIPCVRFQ